MILASNVSKILKVTELSIRGLARETGVSDRTLRRILGQKNTKQPSYFPKEETVEKLAAYSSSTARDLTRKNLKFHAV